MDAVCFWPQPTTIKELQCFLGFSNFYNHFIKNYSSITAPLTSLLKSTPNSLPWNHSRIPAPQGKLYHWSIVCPPLPRQPVTVEVDALTSGVEAVLSQQQGTTSWLHLFDFFSMKLIPLLYNYDIGNHELRTMKLALEEWRHWLEGVCHKCKIWKIFVKSKIQPKTCHMGCLYHSLWFYNFLPSKDQESQGRCIVMSPHS